MEGENIVELISGKRILLYLLREGRIKLIFNEDLKLQTERIAKKLGAT